MIQPIYLYGSAVLRKKAAEADLENKEELKALIQDLWDTLKVSEGVGLAAPQIGVSQRVCVVDGTGMADVYDYLKDFKRCYINPVILEESSEQCEYNEGCLSIPGIYADVVRPVKMKIGYYNENFEYVEEWVDKFACRMTQHEMSHLDGIVFTDLVPPIRKKIIAKKLLNITKGKVATHYKSKIK